MKKIFFSLILSLLCFASLSVAAFADNSYSIEKVDYAVELRTDGSALVTESWDVAFSGESDGFVRDIVIPVEEFETFADIKDLSVSVDGNGCSEVNDSSAVSGTYSLEKTEGKYSIRWKIFSKNETRTFSLRYVQTKAVKLYENRAYYYCTVADRESNLRCRNVTVSVKAPDSCFAEDFSIVESGSLAGKKSDGEVVFSAVNSAGQIKTGLSMPSSLFDTAYLTEIVHDNTAEIISVVVTVLVFVCLAGACVFFVLNYKRIFRLHWENKCRKRVQEESSYKDLSAVFGKISPARFLNIVTDRTLSGADLFIVTFLDLMQRGYINAFSGGFSVSGESYTDTVKRELDKNEKFVLDFFSSDKWQRTVLRPEKFYAEVERFNKSVFFVPVSFLFTSGGRKTVKRCFELKLSAGRHEFVLPEEISDDIFRKGKYSAFDLVISVLNEYSLSLKSGFEKPDAQKFTRNMFVLRENYEEGREIAEKKELERKRNKKRSVKENGEDL